MASRNHKTGAVVSCRYCLTNSNEHILQYFFSDKEDKYKRMLENTFNIQICFLENKYLCLECEEDIRNAAEIKKRVIDIQKSLLEHSNKLTCLGKESPKEEIDFDYGEWSFEDSNKTKSGGVGPDGTEPDGTGLDGTGPDEMGPDRTGPGGTIDAELNSRLEANTTVDDSIIKKVQVKIERLDDEILQPKGKTSMIASDKRNVNKSKDKEKETSNSKKGDCKTSQAPGRIIQIRENTLTLINNSNMCIFIPKKNKYACFFCHKHFLDFKKLRAHSQTHKTDKIKKIKHAVSHNRGLSLKNVEISNLACKTCSHPCADLEELRVHLKKYHDASIEGTEHLLLPFKIENEFKCVICQQDCSNFMTLTVHMNCHSSHNVCEICGTSYNNRLSLRSHIYQTHTKLKCSKCPAVFPTMSAKMRHLRIDHNSGELKRYCTQCDMTFRYTYGLNEHMIRKHGAKKGLHICKLCNKEFANAVGVKVHYKGVHLGERKYECSLCNMSFFTSYDRKRHEKTHGDEKPFSCDFCDIKFRSKDSMRRHLKRMHGG